jgi:hypothetical protein
MAKLTGRDLVFTANGVNLSDHVQAVDVGGSSPAIDVTAAGAAFQDFLAGIPNAEWTVTFFQDFAAAKVDATLFPLWQAGTSFPVTAKPTSGAISAANPEFQMTAILLEYHPIAGDVQSALTTDVTFQNASQTGLVRDVTP